MPGLVRLVDVLGLACSGRVSRSDGAGGCCCRVHGVGWRFTAGGGSRRGGLHGRRGGGLRFVAAAL
ncbi:hypothetical protein EASAB2608_00037 [Streptomyces sp. EAS-AB2608]|nr:hypothetical protein EASAB2608_00037 [Streptomyces sp. EAS-AB2608]